MSAYELKVNKELCDILLPFEEVTDAVHGDNIANASMVIVYARGSRHQLENLQERYNSRLITRLIRQEYLQTGNNTGSKIQAEMPQHVKWVSVNPNPNPNMTGLSTHWQQHWIQDSLLQHGK